MKDIAVVNTCRLLVSFILVFMAVLTFERNALWRSGESLWRDALHKSPGKSRPHINLAISLIDGGGNEAEAEAELKKALELKPYHPLALNQLGRLYSQRGLHEEAIRSYEHALGKYPDIDWLCYGFAMALERAGRTVEAEAAYRKSISLKPENLSAIIRLGHLLENEGRREEMLELLGGAVYENPELLEEQPYLRQILGVGDNAREQVK